jgi:hypothetical protein
VFRIRGWRHEPVTDVDKLNQIEPAIRASIAGRYQIDQIDAAPLRCSHTWRRWGIRIKKPDGSGTLEPDP